MEITASHLDRSPTTPRIAPLPTLHIATDAFVSWRRTADLLFNPSSRAGDAFNASFTVFHFHRFLLCSGRLDAARYGRDRARLGWCDLDHYVLHVPLQRGLACGNGLRVRARDAVLLDLAQPAAFRMTRGAALSLVIPRTALLHDGDRLHGLRLCGKSAAGRLLASLLSSLAVAAPDLTQDQGLHLSQPVLSMVAACLVGAVAQRPAIVPSGHDELGRRVRRYIELNLHRDDLSPAMLAKALGTSRSQLYRAFERFGGVGHYLQRRRLRRCLLALGEPGNAERRIGDVAYAHGFIDEAHFSKVFRKTFGLSPRAARQALQRGELAAMASQAPADAHGPALARWIHDLASH
ncbi:MULTISPECIES: helix-turn-helix domain-containing protein [unclassified Pseudomonas]|uniref:helix-turn-helix domain-containing protein n=1 Tax=unclassified Pseudomonas TaxID=196821 RepID=UPI002446AEEE|nr:MULTISPECIES: helix-turn-helix domain-containing protein [unclassified Pseudomonas]MDH0301001.1 helix-turn-helix domain-containing protein [Pseudomonas sp. GD04091]MDH1983467.1 helix-turn-helix domain-containing protein [Pseudomonas sp. GD03689]